MNNCNRRRTREIEDLPGPSFKPAIPTFIYEDGVPASVSGNPSYRPLEKIRKLDCAQNADITDLFNVYKTSMYYSSLGRVDYKYPDGNSNDLSYCDHVSGMRLVAQFRSTTFSLKFY